jgi:replication-associated recombination protein RarA
VRQATAALAAVKAIGMPECNLVLAQVALFLS